jgi:hypothetical protein
MRKLLRKKSGSGTLSHKAGIRIVNCHEWANDAQAGKPVADGNR